MFGREGTRWMLGALVALILGAWVGATRAALDLGGRWEFALDPRGTGEAEGLFSDALPDWVTLPGTTDTNRKGTPASDRPETNHLTRRFRYEGAAWYAREVEIPADWAGRRIDLFLERTRPSAVWVDGHPAGSCGFLSAPHVYDLTAWLTPGRHRVAVRVDNGAAIPAPVRRNSHACSESTQTNWNGIIGRMELRARDPLHIAAVVTFPSVRDRSVRVRVRFSTGKGLGGRKVRLSAEAFNAAAAHRPEPKTFPLREGEAEAEFTLSLGRDVLPWSDAAPALYRLTVALEGGDATESVFGLRDFEVRGRRFLLNGAPVFLRGRHDACVFPLTGHPPMDVPAWRRYFRTCKAYGLNHVRFHSWCPPEACFTAADLEGVLLQPELPLWGVVNGGDTRLLDFLKADGEALLRAYANHPSCVLFALGNELSGEARTLQALVAHFRALEPRPRYACASNAYLGQRGALPGEDFLVTCRVGEGPGTSTHVRASFSFADAEEGGLLNGTPPNTRATFDAALARANLPVISHETGQFQSYPDYAQLSRYTGVLAPRNLETFRERLRKAGMSALAPAFVRASGAWATELYRADVEMCLRSGGLAGFQLLDLQDYPGQGSAYVGLLDAFMESKGFVTPERWREWCCETVPLLAADAYCWVEGDRFVADLLVSNHGDDLAGKRLRWRLTIGERTLGQGTLPLPAGRGRLEAGGISLPLPTLGRAHRAELLLDIPGTPYRNRYPLWIYPKPPATPPEGILQTCALDAPTLAHLAAGGRALLTPKRDACRKATVGGLFQTDYWNYRMFRTICESMRRPVSPGTLGLLIDAQHPALADFPTETHTHWQWFPIVKHSYPLILDALPGDIRPIVQAIDNVERNHRLGLLFEFSVNGGRLLVCMADLEAAAQSPSGRHFRDALLRYAASPAFRPTHALPPETLQALLDARAKTGDLPPLHNVSYD